MKKRVRDRQDEFIAWDSALDGLNVPVGDHRVGCVCLDADCREAEDH